MSAERPDRPGTEPGTEAFDPRPFDPVALDTDSFAAADLEPGLDQLVRALTAGAAADELAGEAAALAMFRASRPGPSWRPRLRDRSGLAAAAVAVALAGSTAAAAYAAVLPASMQHAAHRLLDRIGVPDAPGGHGAAGPTGPVPGGAGGRQTAGTTPTGAPAPGGQPGPGPASVPAGTTGLVLVITRPRVAAGGSETFVAQLTASGRAAGAGQVIGLLERPAGSTQWQAAGQAVTGARGTALLVARDLTVNAAFEVTGPGGARSAPVQVTVVPAVTLSVTSGAGGGLGRPALVLTAAVTAGAPGDVVVLQRLAGGGWQTIREQGLGADGQAVFTVAPPLAVRVYRAVVLATGSHGVGVSAAVRA